MPKRILILFAHPSIDRSEVNAELLSASRGRDAVTVVDLYAEYPDYRIDIDREQQRLREHDVVVLMFPLYWYSTPAILKEWQDLVLEYGFAYGQGGDAVAGKILLCAITAGGPARAYHADGFNQYTIRELLRPLEQMAAFCGMSFVAPFALFAARTAVEDDRVQHHVDDWVRVLEALRAGRFDSAAAAGLRTLNDGLDDVLEGEDQDDTAATEGAGEDA